jgi:hypothetical protein
MEQRMETLLSLKTNIQDNRDSMRALQMIRNKQQAVVDSEEMAERQKAIEEGLNPDEVILKRRRMQNFVKEKELFEKRQLKNKVAIVDKLLREQKDAKRKEKMHQQPHWQDKWLQQDTSCSTIISHATDSKTKEADQVGSVSVVRVDVQGDGMSTGQQHKDDENILTEPTSTTDDFKSEGGQVQGRKDKPVGIQGLWQTSEQKSPSEQSKVKQQSKMEKEIMQRVMDKLKESAVIRQVAAGREFKGKPFNSKPEIVLFKDFDLGKTYQKRVVLTNVSYSANYCKLQGISESLANCIDIRFDPPGSMSAGMTCEMTVTFTPEINTDLEGEISFLAQTGPFSVPIQCVTKKCRVSVNCSCVEFHPACVGETRKRTIRLSNDGALGTDYEIEPLSGYPHVQKRDSQKGYAQRDYSQSKSAVIQPIQLIISEHEIERVKSPSVPPEIEMPNGSSTSDAIACGKPLERVSSTTLDTVVEREDEVDEEPTNEESTEIKESKRKMSEVISDVSETKGTQVTTSVIDSTAETDQSLVQSEVTVEMVTSTQVLIESGKENMGEVSGVLQPVEGPIFPLKLGMNSKGYLDPFSAVDIEFVFVPTIAGNFEEKYKIVFAEEETKDLMLTVTASAIDLPIYVEREVIDLKICMLERLYQDSVTVHNRSATALRVTFDVPPNVREHMEVLPKHGLVQGESSFSAQLKFLPRHSVLDACNEHVNEYTGKLNIPISLQVVDQTRPVPFNVQATITGSDLEFSNTQVDFGICTIYESVVSSIHLTNKSILTQTFGFVQLPKCVDVQPNDGFGTLLPEETISLDIIFSPKKPMEYKFRLQCKSGIGREFVIDCSAVAILPALRLSKTLIEFCPTPVEDSRSTHIYVENPIHSCLSEESIRGQTPPSLPMAFEFAVPADIPLSISPTVGIVKPGQKQEVSVLFFPRLDTTVVRARAWSLAKEKAAQAARDAREAAEIAAAKDMEEASQAQGQKKKKLSGRKSSGSKGAPRSHSSMVESRKDLRKTSDVIEISEPAESSDDYWEAYATLLRNFEKESTRVFVPCFVAAVRKPGQLEYRPQDTLYLELSLPTVRPKLVVISDHGRRSIDYGPVCKGYMKIKTVTVKNISEEILTLRSSVLDPDGTFEMRNALRPVLPGRVHNIMLGFCPVSAEKFCEVFKVLYGDSSIPLRLCGKGITPEVSLSLNQDVIDLGDLLPGDSPSFTKFTITNTSPISVQYCVRLDSSLAGLKSARRFGSNQFDTGVRCNDGSCAFDVSPFAAGIKAGESKEVSVTFSPDHPSQNYFDTARIELSTQDEAKAVRLTGRCWPNTVYSTGWDEFASRREFLGADFQTLGAEIDGKLPTVTVSLTCRSLGGKPSTRQIEIGCIKSALVKKGSGEFAFDPLPASLAKTFQIDNLKTALEGGSRKTIAVTFCPPADHKPSEVFTAKTMLTLKGEKIQQLEVHLRGIIKSASLGC